MDKQQGALIIGSLAMIVVLFFGFNTKPPKQRLIEKSRAGDVELRETENIVRKAKNTLPEDLRKRIQGLENIVEGATDDSTRIEALRSISSTWFDQKEYVTAGFFAEQLAGIAQTPESWAIAGTTYSAKFTSGPDDADLVKLAVAGTIRCFENAISLNPDNSDYRVDLAVCYADFPPEGNPMKGIQLLLELNRSNPENISVLFHLARFGLRTGQYEKARERLEKALSLDPSQRRLHCLMAAVLRKTLQPETEIEKYQTLCDEK